MEMTHIWYHLKRVNSSPLLSALNLTAISSPVDVKSNTAPAYHVLQPGMSFTELKKDFFLLAEQGDDNYRDNMQNIETFLGKITIISSKSRK